MSRLAQWKAEQKENENKKPVPITGYPGFAKTGIDEETWKSQQPKQDKRKLASKVYDAVNLIDSGRSFTNAEADDEEKNKTAKNQLGDLAGNFFSGTEKVVDSVEALTGITEKRQKDLDKQYADKKISRKQYQAELKKMQEDTAWAGTEDKGLGDRVKKSAGVSAQAVSEWLPAGKGAKAATALKKGVTEVAEDGTKIAVSRLAKAKLAAKVATEQFGTGVLGGTGGALADDTTDLTSIEGIRKVATEALTSGATSAVMGAGGVYAPKIKLPGKGKTTEVAEKAIDALAPKNKPGSTSKLAAVVDEVPAEIDDLDIPTFMRRTSTEAAKEDIQKIRMDKVENPIKDAYKAADSLERGKNNARAAVAAIGEDPADPMNIPAFQRKSAASKIDEINADLDNVDAQLAALPDELNMQKHKFNARKELAEQIKQNPSKKTQLIDLYNRRMSVVENSDSLEALRTNLSEKRQQLQDGLDYNLSVNDAITPKPQQVPGAPEVPAATPQARAVEALAAVEPNQSPTLEAPVVVERKGGTGGSAPREGNITPPDEVEAPTASNMSQKAPLREKDVVANADVEDGSVIVAPVKMKVLADLEDEADARVGKAFRESGRGAAQATETKAQQGAQYIVDDLDKLQRETGLGVDSIDRDVAAKLTGEVKRTSFQEFKDKMGRNFQDTLTYAAKTLGKPGTDFVYDMLKGNKFKRDALDALRDPMLEINKINRKLSGAGKVTNRGGSVTLKRDVGLRVGQALDDRANAAKYLKSPDEQALFDGYVKIFDYVKQLREKAGLETVENYRPWVNMKDASEPPTWLADSITTKRVETLSRFSKERVSQEAGDNVDNNLADMIYGYVNSQLNELSYDAPVRKFKAGFDNISAGTKANVAEMNDGMDYLHTMVQQAVNPARKDPLERIITKGASNVYSSVLPFNIKLALQNKAQKFAANSRVSKGARSLVKSMDVNDLKELESGLVFGDQTVFGTLEDLNPGAATKKTIAEKLKKIDPYQKSEEGNVISSYRKGVAQAILDSDAYKGAVKSGKSKAEAAKIALADPQVKENAIRRGNVIVNDTQFGASPLARPQALREEGNLLGIPKKTLTMFTRFPIGMSQHVLETLDSKSTRALEMLKNGDPRASSIAEMGTNYHALLSSLQDADKALKAGHDIGIPQDVLNEQIRTVTKNLDVIDTEAKKASQIRGGKTLKNFGKMWAAAAAIQVIFDGGIQSFADDPGGESADALAKSNPTASGMVYGQNSKLGGITSAASPINKYGKVNTRALTNYVPGLGLVVNRGRDVKNLVQSLTGNGDDK